MLNKLIEFSLKNRFLIIILTFILAVAGFISLSKLSIDAFPDTTPVQVQINTVAPSLNPLEIEQQISFPVELAISGLPKLKLVRSISKFGLSQVVVIFEDGTDIYFARQLVMERLQSIELPQNTPQPTLGPVATGLGEIFHYLIQSNTHNLTQITTAQNWIIKPQLRMVSGVAEVNTWGGFEKQYHVLIRPEFLVKYQLTFEEIFEALERNNRNIGGGIITPHEGEAFLVHGLGLVSSISEIENIVIKAIDGIPIYIRDVANIEIGHEIRRAAVTANGKGEQVLGLGFMLMGENSHIVTQRLKNKLKEAQKSLPSGMTVELVYDRTELVDAVLNTVKKNLFEGALLVIAILFIFLGNLRAGLIVALAIPISMLFAFNAMLYFGIAGSLMSLGALDFGLIVDSSVIMVENNVHCLSTQDQRSRLNIVRDASIEVRKPTMFGELIIMVVYLPILFLEGVEGKLFVPMALTVIFALAGSMILSLTLMPVLCSLFLQKKVKTKDPWLIRILKWLYRPILYLALRFRLLVIIGAVALLIFSGWVATRLGSEFIPRLEEGALVVNTVRLAGVSLEESVRYGTRIEKTLLNEFPNEIKNIWTRTGTPEVATDPMGLEVSDIFITLKSKKKWKRATSQEELVILLSRTLQGLPGMRSAFTQPIEMRVNEMIAGIRTDLGIKIFGDDFDVLVQLSEQVEDILKKTYGSAELVTEQLTGQPVLQIRIRPDDIARFGISRDDVLLAVECIGGRKIGEIREGQMRFALVTRLQKQYRQNPQAIKGILLRTVDGKQVLLEKVADVELVEGPTVISREWGRRRIVVSCNVRDRDVGSFVTEVKKRINKELKFPPGYSVDYGGQFENLERARLRLTIIVPIALILIFILLYTTYNSVRDAMIIFTGVPFATIGGVLALYLRGMPFTISAGVGFIALSGVAVLNGLVMVSSIRKLLEERNTLDNAITEAAESRLRAVLMTALVASFGFIPMALATSVGAEVQRPLATVVIGGIITATMLTLIVLPVLYSFFGKADNCEQKS